jgi:hypothetical protein
VDTSTKSSIFETLFLRFCGGSAEGEVQYSMVFTVSNTHHTFCVKLHFVMIFGTFLGSFGEPFRLLGVLLGTLLEVVFFGSSEGNQDGWVIIGNHE